MYTDFTNLTNDEWSSGITVLITDEFQTLQIYPYHFSQTAPNSSSFWL